MFSKATNFIFSAGIAETFSCLNVQINKKPQKLSARPKVSGNFVTKLHYYLQVCQIGGLYFEISIFFPAINMLED